MLTKTQKHVTLPDGTQVLTSETPEPWWAHNDTTGYMDPRLLAPDPDQPRKRMNPTKLAELEKSIATCGVREVITITPRAHAPWARVEPRHEHLSHVIVSGHRRVEAALKAELRAVPVRIRIYQNEPMHRTDGGVLNSCRDDLTELEQGFDYLREKKAGKTIAQIADAHGINQQTAHNRINLTKLHPDLHQLLALDSHGKKRLLPMYPAGILGGLKAPTAQELEDLAVNFADTVNATQVTGHDSFEKLDEDARRFAMQKLLAHVIVTRKLNSVRAAEFIHDRTLRFSAGRLYPRKTTRYQPARRKDILANLASEVVGSSIIDWSPGEFRRVFDNSSREDIDVFIQKLKDAQAVFDGLIKILTGIRNSKRATSAEVMQLMERKKTRT